MKVYVLGLAGDIRGNLLYGNIFGIFNTIPTVEDLMHCESLVSDLGKQMEVYEPIMQQYRTIQDYIAKHYIGLYSGLNDLDEALEIEDPICVQEWEVTDLLN